MADVQAVQTARAPLPIAPPDSEMWPMPRNTMPPTLPDSSMMEKLVHDLQIFMAKSAMQFHARDLHRAEPKPHQCNQCFKSFSSNHQLVQHIRVHTGEKPYRCSYCDRRFKQLSHVQQHTRLHTGERPYKCHVPECGRAFIQLSNLQQHLRNHDAQQERAKNRPFQCHVCGKGFATESSLRTHASKHAALIGTSATPACPLCQKVFTTTEALIEHMTIHKEGSSSSNSNPGMGGDGRNSSLMTIFPPIIQEDGPKAILQQSQEPKESGVSASLQQQDQGNSQQTQPNPSGPAVSEVLPLNQSNPVTSINHTPSQAQVPPSTSLFQNPFSLPHPIGGVNNVLQCNPPPPSIMSPQSGVPMDNWAYGIRRRTATHACPVCGKHYVNEGSLRKHLASHPETAPFTAALRMWPCTVCPAVFPFEAGLIAHMEQMRMDSKHQFAAQYMLSRVAAERKFMERESPTNTLTNPLLRPDVLSSIIQSGGTTSTNHNTEQHGPLPSPPTSPPQGVESKLSNTLSESPRPQRNPDTHNQQNTLNHLQSPVPQRPSNEENPGPSFSANQGSFTCGTETEDEEDIAETPQQQNESIRKMQAVNMEAVLRFAAATASNSNMGVPLPGPSTSYADSRLEHALRLHQALGFALPQHHPAYLQQQFPYQHTSQHYNPMGQNMSHLNQGGHWTHLQNMNHQPHSSN
ncbi:zinc finger protein 628-like isoform X2 [Artemia franciscana]|uniref:C2H2-type domain-containing protein n=1 Tax=Artemia franciscana TaxID=6661 RepID=A0AA88KTS1_ARTSF|nr:hypothetical protein QYM36_016480 [Artemia franciscana]